MKILIIIITVLISTNIFAQEDEHKKSCYNVLERIKHHDNVENYLTSNKIVEICEDKPTRINTMICTVSFFIASNGTYQNSSDSLGLSFETIDNDCQRSDYQEAQTPEYKEIVQDTAKCINNIRSLLTFENPIEGKKILNGNNENSKFVFDTCSSPITRPLYVSLYEGHKKCAEKRIHTSIKDHPSRRDNTMLVPTYITNTSEPLNLYVKHALEEDSYASHNYLFGMAIHSYDVCSKTKYLGKSIGDYYNNPAFKTCMQKSEGATDTLEQICAHVLELYEDAEYGSTKLTQGQINEGLDDDRGIKSDQFVGELQSLKTSEKAPASSRE